MMKYAIRWEDDFPTCYFDTFTEALQFLRKIKKEQGVGGTIEKV